MRRSFDTLGYVIESVLTGLEMGARTREYLALTLWPDIVGDQIARITAVRSVHSGVLQIDVESATWAQELRLCRGELVAKINSHVGRDAIKDIEFRVRTPLQKAPATKQKALKKKPGEPSEIQLTLEDCQNIAQTGQQVGDLELRQALTSTMASYRRMDRWMEQNGWKRCAKCAALFQRKTTCPFCDAPLERTVPKRPSARARRVIGGQNDDREGN